MKARLNVQESVASLNFVPIVCVLFTKEVHVGSHEDAKCEVLLLHRPLLPHRVHLRPQVEPLRDVSPKQGYQVKFLKDDWKDYRVQCSKSKQSLHFCFYEFLDLQNWSGFDFSPFERVNLNCFQSQIDIYISKWILDLGFCR